MEKSFPALSQRFITILPRTLVGVGLLGIVSGCDHRSVPFKQADYKGAKVALAIKSELLPLKEIAESAGLRDATETEVNERMTSMRFYSAHTRKPDYMVAVLDEGSGIFILRFVLLGCLAGDKWQAVRRTNAKAYTRFPELWVEHSGKRHRYLVEGKAETKVTLFEISQVQ